MLRRIVILIALFTVPVFAAPANPGTTAVKLANTTIEGLLKQKVPAGSPAEKALAAKVTASVRSFLDIDELGKSAMTDQWSKLTKPQQDEFLKVLRDLIEANYINGLRANLAYTVQYTGEGTNTAGNTVVNTTITTQRKGRPYTIKIDYVLVKNGTSLRAFDVVTDGVGLVANYRTMFNKLITEKGFPALIQRMKDKLATLNAAPATPATPAPAPPPPPPTKPAKG
jgi:phospholipid transport system substrate-binding protein